MASFRLVNQVSNRIKLKSAFARRYDVREMRRGETEKVIETGITKREVDRILVTLYHENYNVVPRSDGFVCDAPDGESTIYVMHSLQNFA